MLIMKQPQCNSGKGQKFHKEIQKNYDEFDQKQPQCNSGKRPMSDYLRFLVGPKAHVYHTPWSIIMMEMMMILKLIRFPIFIVGDDDGHKAIDNSQFYCSKRWIFPRVDWLWCLFVHFHICFIFHNFMISYFHHHGICLCSKR